MNDRITIRWRDQNYLVITLTESAPNILKVAGHKLPTIHKTSVEARAHRSPLTPIGRFLQRPKIGLRPFFQQSGFEERETYFAQEVNGAAVIVCLDNQINNDLDQFVLPMINERDPH